MKKFTKKNIYIAHIILPILTLLCFAGFIGSLLFPNKVLDTYKINVTEEEGDTEFTIPLSQEEKISYVMNATANPMQGIQVGISKEGETQEGVLLHYQVYRQDKEKDTLLGELLSDNVYDVELGDNLQYVYLPFGNSEKCTGDIVVCFSYESEKENGKAPALLANHTMVQNTITMVGDTILDGSLKSMYIYTHDTYPLLYDFRLMTFVFLAASMAVTYPKRKSKEGKTDEK